MASLSLCWQVLYAALRSNSNRQFYDRIAPIYDQVFVGHRRHAVNMALLLCTNFSGRESASRVLDLGCGTGMLSRMLADRGFAVTALDISFESLRTMQNMEPRMCTLQADATRLPFSAGAFQAVLSLGAWRHFSEPQQVMMEVRRILTRDGLLITGYFPPALAGALHQGHGPLRRVMVGLYQRVVGKLGYVDRADSSLEPQTVSLAEQHFARVSTVTSGKHWHLIMAQAPVND